jgi:glycerophosphoryl diester phosphodiesterase
VTRPLVIAHRGASGYLPEHTLAAKTLAFEMGADFLEQDIVASRDNELIVLHDVLLDRVSDVALRFPDRHRDDGRYYVRDFDLDEIRSLRAWERMRADGTAVYPGRYPVQRGDFRFNTLAEELALVQRLNADHDRSVGVYPEVKRPAWHKEEGVDIAPMLLGTLADFGYEERPDLVYVQCFDDAEIRRLRNELNCPFKLVQLIGKNWWLEAETDYDAMRTDAGLREIADSADAIGPHIEHLFIQGADSVPVSTGLVEMAHDAGLAVHPYTFRVDELPAGFSSFEDLVSFCVSELGIDGLFTDFPDRVVELKFP